VDSLWSRPPEKLIEIDRYLGCAIAGLIAESRKMIDHARVTAQNLDNEDTKVERVTRAVCDLSWFGEGVDGESPTPMCRPYGVALLIAGIDKLGPQLQVLFPIRLCILFEILKVYSRYHTDPSGSFVCYNAKAIGSRSSHAEEILRKQWHKVHFLGVVQLFFPKTHL
jgi:20S proteasome subunit alpha 5